ncbi:MAG: hypothetical protein AAGB19_19750, partial [Cyanobacteria bacterium P01_F01_bin.3]
IESTDIRFSQAGDDLMLDVLSAKAQILLHDWYTSPVDQIDSFQVSNGATLDKQQVNGLVITWSQYESGALDSAGLNAAINSSWESASVLG